MQALRSHLAILLLLCFTRVLLPDTWVLALHGHGHTAEISPAAGRPTAKALLTAKHQHCQTDHFCALPLPLSYAWQFGRPAGYQRPGATPQGSVWQRPAPLARLLRGPPARA